MVFSSLEFIFRFLPIFFLAYFTTPARYRNIVLVVGSLVFYAVGETVYIFLMMASILLNYVLAIGISDSRGRGRAGMLLAVGLAVDLGLLFFFKYLNFFVENICAVTGFRAPTIDVALPLGISFYTFQIMSYIIDVYRKKYPAGRNLIEVAAYISMFPQLIAGPIVTFDEVQPRLRERKISPANIENGLLLFVVGLVYRLCWQIR